LFGKPKRNKVKMPYVKRDGSTAGGYMGYVVREGVERKRKKKGVFPFD